METNRAVNRELIGKLVMAIERIAGMHASNTDGIVEARNARADALRRIAEMVTPALPALINRRDVGCKLECGLTLARGGVWYGENLIPLTDEQLGEWRLDPIDVIREVLDKLDDQGDGLGRSNDELSAELRRLRGLALILS